MEYSEKILKENIKRKVKRIKEECEMQCCDDCFVFDFIIRELNHLDRMVEKLSQYDKFTESYHKED